MNDLELCKKIAEIEQVPLNPAILEHDKLCVTIPPDGFTRQKYNPLTDDALCFQLMVKYDVDLSAPYRVNDETEWNAEIFTLDYADALSFYDESPNKAICLAIIAAHQ